MESTSGEIRIPDMRIRSPRLSVMGNTRFKN